MQPTMRDGSPRRTVPQIRRLCIPVSAPRYNAAYVICTLYRKLFYILLGGCAIHQWHSHGRAEQAGRCKPYQIRPVEAVAAPLSGLLHVDKATRPFIHAGVFHKLLQPFDVVFKQ